MAIAQSIQSIIPAQGHGLFVSKLATALSTTGEQTTSITAISPTFKRGKIRVHIDTLGGTTPVIAAVKIRVTDTTTPYFVFSAATVGVTGQGVDFVAEFVVETACTQIDVLTTMTGTTPTANLDIEAVVTI